MTVRAIGPPICGGIIVLPATQGAFSKACNYLRKAENNMSKTLSSSLFLIIALAGPAMASVVGPAPEVDGGIVGLMLAAGVVYLIKRRRRTRP